MMVLGSRGLAMSVLFWVMANGFVIDKFMIDKVYKF